MEIDGEPWFTLKDIGDLLGLVKHNGNYAHLAERCSGDVRRLLKLGAFFSMPNIESINILFPRTANQVLAVFEAGLYEPMLRSAKTVRRLLLDWVTGDVLPMAQTFNALIGYLEE